LPGPKKELKIAECRLLIVEAILVSKSTIGNQQSEFIIQNSTLKSLLLKHKIPIIDQDLCKTSKQTMQRRGAAAVKLNSSDLPSPLLFLIFLNLNF
jgi:hypothetical protein